MPGMYPNDATLASGQKVFNLSPTGQYQQGSTLDPQTLNLILNNLQAVIVGAGLTPNNLDSDQLFLALSKVNKGSLPIGTPFLLWEETAPSPSWTPLDGGVIPCAAVPLLVAKRYVGDALNATAPYWYKTNGTTPATAAANRSKIGTHIALPNLVGYYLKAKRADEVLGGLYEDTLKSHNHSLGDGANNFLGVPNGGNQIGWGALGRTDYATTSNSGQAETEPKHIALNPFCFNGN